MTPTLIVPGDNATELERYATSELQRLLGGQSAHIPPPTIPGDALPHLLDAAPTGDLIVFGTQENNPAIARLLAAGFLPAPAQPQGYAMRCARHPVDKRRQILAIVGADAAGALYALRDLEHYGRDYLYNESGRLSAFAFLSLRLSAHRVSRALGLGLQYAG